VAWHGGRHERELADWVAVPSVDAGPQRVRCRPSAALVEPRGSGVSAVEEVFALTAPAPERPLPGDPDEPILPEPGPDVPRPIEPEPESAPEPLIPGGEFAVHARG
jgi:hypothetical protein